MLLKMSVKETASNIIKQKILNRIKREYLALLDQVHQCILQTIDDIMLSYVKAHLVKLGPFMLHSQQYVLTPFLFQLSQNFLIFPDYQTLQQHLLLVCRGNLHNNVMH